MEKKILYICIIIISAYCIYQKISFNSQVRANSENQQINYPLLALKDGVEIEDSCKGRMIDDIKITTTEGKEDYLYNTLSEYSDGYYLLVISSIKACSNCREQILKIWNEVYREKKDTPILFIVTEDRDIKKSSIRQIKASIKGLDIDIPFYLDHESNLLGFFGVTPYQTPLSVILDHNKKVIAVDKASELTGERTIAFKNFFLSLNASEVK